MIQIKDITEEHVGYVVEEIGHGRDRADLTEELRRGGMTIAAAATTINRAEERQV